MKRRDFLNQIGVSAGAAALSAVSPASIASAVGKTTVALLGDILLLRRISQLKNPDFLALTDILRKADCTWGNCELPILDPLTVYPAPKRLDPHVCGEPWVADELAWLGIDAVGFANNHTMDFGDRGMIQTLHHLDRVGINHSGAGEDLSLASRPGYIDSRSGRIAHVNMASTFPPYFAASIAHPYVQGRPGLNPVHVNRVFQATEELFNGMQDFQKFMFMEQGYARFMDLIERMLGDKVMIGDHVVEKAEARGFRESVAEPDQKRIVQQIKAASNMSHVTLATIHCHESYQDLTRPSLFLQDFAKACLDGGADAFVGHGPHVLRGIEMYEGKPIFYSIGNFAFQYESMSNIPAEAYLAAGKPKDEVDASKFFDFIPYPKDPIYWRSVVPVLTYEGGKLTEALLYPIEMGFGASLYERGTPRLVRGELGGEIIQSLSDLSEPYGTQLTYEDGIGRIVL